MRKYQICFKDLFLVLIAIFNYEFFEVKRIVNKSEEKLEYLCKTDEGYLPLRIKKQVKFCVFSNRAELAVIFGNDIVDTRATFIILSVR